MKKTEIEKLLHDTCDYLQNVGSVDVSQRALLNKTYTITEKEIDAMGVTMALCGHVINGTIKTKSATQLANALFVIYAQSVENEFDTCKGCKND